MVLGQKELRQEVRTYPRKIHVGTDESGRVLQGPFAIHTPKTHLFALYVACRGGGGLCSFPACKGGALMCC